MLIYEKCLFLFEANCLNIPDFSLHVFLFSNYQTTVINFASLCLKEIEVTLLSLHFFSTKLKSIF